MSDVLVIFDGNWADEMDVRGFMIWKEENWNAMLQEIPEGGFTESIGSNQEMEFSDVKDYISNIKLFKITDEERATLLKFFPYGHFGKFVSYEG